MPYNGYLIKAYLNMYQSGSTDVTGEGINITIWNDDGFGFPGTELGRVNITYPNIAWYPTELEVDLRSLGPLYFAAGQDFHIGYTTVNQSAGNVVAILSDEGSGPILSRSSEYWGSSWGLMINDWGIDVDFLIAADVCSGACVIYVPDDYPTIQQAVDNASDGCIIIVGDGIYRENVVINKSITLTAGSSPIIDGMGGYGINVTANDTIVQGMTVINCSTGIYVHNDSFTIHDVTLDDNTVFNCTYSQGNGIRFSSVINSTINNTRVNDTLRGVSLGSSSYNNITNNQVYDNSIYGIYLFSSSNNNISLNHVYNNMEGMVLVVFSNSNNITGGNVIHHNINNGIFLQTASYNNITDNDIYNNSNGIHIEPAMSNAEYNTLSLNRIYNNSDNGILLNASGPPVRYNNITDNRIYNNTCGIRLESSNDNTLINNTIYNATGNDAYGVYSLNANDNTFENTTICNYTMVTGTAYGVYMENSSNTEFINLTMYKLDMAVQIDYGVYLNNSHWNNFTNIVIYDLNGDFADYGIYLTNSGNNSFENTSIYNLTASNGDAYGIYLSYSDNNTFSGNMSISNLDPIADFDVFGIYLTSSDNNEFLDNITISNMEGDYYGYGIYLSSSDNNTFFGDIAISNVTLHSGEIGYGIYLSSSDNNTFLGGIDILDFEVEAGDGYGVYLTSSDNNTFSGNITIPDFDIYHDAYGVYLNGSDDNNFTGLINFSGWGYPTGMDFGISGIYLTRSDHNLFDSLLISDLSCSWYVVSGIFLNYSDGNTFNNAAISGLSNGLNVYGVYFNNSDENIFNSTVVESMNGNYAYGIRISKSHNNVFNNTNISHIEGSTEAFGISVSSVPSGSDNNVFSEGSISNITAPTWWSFHSCEYSDNNTIINYTLSSYPTTISFIYGNGIALKSVEEPYPSDMISMDKYVDITDVTENSWINISIYYNDTGLWGIESSLKLYHWNGTDWEEVPSILNKAKNYVQANITTFSQFGVFASEINVTLHLEKPWNLITIPIENTWTAETLGQNISGCGVVTKWDATLQRYVDHIVEINTPGNPNFDIEDGVAYFIGVYHDTDFLIQGDYIDTISVKLKPGLNMIGWANIGNTTAESFGENITKCTHDIKWNESKQHFVTHTVGYAANNFNVAIGRGMFVIITGTHDVTWNGGR